MSGTVGDGGSATGTSTSEVDTSAGPARVLLDRPGGTPAGVLVLGHGAGGGVDGPDLVAVRDRCRAGGWAVARVVQPYRVAGRRAPAPAPRLDAAFTVCVAALRADPALAAAPLVVGGRSSGARVACRTAGPLGAAAVVALAFPLHPPGRPERSRLAELTGVAVPALVVQGERDPFGAPAEFPPGTDLVTVVGADHSLRGAARPAVVADAVAGWLARFARRA